MNKEEIYMMFLNNEEIKIRDHEKLKEYIDHCFNNRVEKHIKFKTANHHILPKSLFPEFESFTVHNWNSSMLFHKDHYTVHYLLWKSIDSKEMTFALHMMNNDKNGKLTNSDLTVMSNLEEYQQLGEEQAKYNGDIHIGMKHSEETKQAQSDRVRGEKNPMFGRKGELSPIFGEKNIWFGKHLSPETCEKLRIANLGKKASPETCQKMSINNTGEGNPMFGKHHTTETKQKISDAHKGKKHTDETKQLWSDQRKGKKQSKKTVEKRCRTTKRKTAMKRYMSIYLLIDVLEKHLNNDSVLQFDVLNMLSNVRILKDKTHHRYGMKLPKDEIMRRERSRRITRLRKKLIHIYLILNKGL